MRIRRILSASLRTGRTEVQMKRRIPFLLTFVVAPLFAAAARGETRPVHWTESAPPARVAACAVYDSASDRIVELGGSLGGASYRRSRLPAWECTLGGTGTWQRSALPSFANSSPASSALDPARREYWQFGVGLPHGFAARLGLAPGTGWSLVPLTTDVDTWDAMAFDVAHDRILGLAHLVGPGPDDTLALFSAPIAESLVFTRLPISGPQPTGIYGLTVVWDRAKAAFVVLAGGTLTAPIAGILILTTGEDRHWESVTPQPDPVAGSPSNLYAGLAAADPGSSDLYLVEYTHPFAPISFVLEGQLWKLEREPSPRWVRMPPPPVMAIRAALAVDTRRRRLVMLGGQDDALVVLPAVQWFDISTGQWTTSDAAPSAPDAGPAGRDAGRTPRRPVVRHFDRPVDYGRRAARSRSARPLRRRLRSPSGPSAHLRRLPGNQLHLAQRSLGAHVARRAVAPRRGRRHAPARTSGRHARRGPGTGPDAAPRGLARAPVLGRSLGARASGFTRMGPAITERRRTRPGG